MNNLTNQITTQLDAAADEIAMFFKGKKDLIFSLAAVAVIVYGFELFNFNLTIDEEIHAFGVAPSVWITQGRWGMYLLNKFLLPYTVVPFLPLFLALLFQICAALFLLDGWGVKSRIHQIVVGSVFLAYPGIAFMYTFSTINYGIGVGLFFVGLALLVFERLVGWKKALAVIPAAFAIAIYQGFLVALVAVYLVNYIVHQIEGRKRALFDLILPAGIVLGGTILYYLIHKVLVTFFIPESNYTTQYFDIPFLRNHFQYVLSSVYTWMTRVYSGDKGVYGTQIGILWPILGMSTIGFTYTLIRSKIIFVKKAGALVFFVLLFLLPFMTGLLMGGYIAMRFLVALPVVIAGIIYLGNICNQKYFSALMAALTIFCVLQFAVSANHLFAASHLALEEDRLVAVNLIKSIEEAKAQAGSEEVKYLEIVGYLKRPSTQLIPKIETFGASYFEWDQGNVNRVIFFLQTLGYQGLSALPIDRRGLFVEQANLLPSWPQEGSVVVVQDTVLIKFSSYSILQKEQICEYSRRHAQKQSEAFCK